MRSLLLLGLLLLSNLLFSQVNVDSLSHINYQALHNANLNDVWGYVDELGNEYAIVGTTKGTSIVDVTDPTNPIEIFWIAGSESIWRDPCVYGDHAFVTTEASDGFLIIDLSPLPASTVLPTSTYTGPVGSSWQSAHTCYVDENGFAYIFGANRGNGGAIMLDVNTDPMNPIEVGDFNDWYVHDGFVRNDTMYLAHIADGFFSLVDVSDKANPVLLGTKATPNDFTHNIWPSTNGQFVFTTDEVSGSFIAAYDITDPSNIVEVDRIQNSPGQGVIPHNTHVKGNYLITSYYSDGIVIHDITHPHNIVQIGQYDTYPSQTTGFDGCWGVYPFLPSGTILASDITEGLFILGPTYEQAAYLEGTITDAVSSLPLDNVQVKIVVNVQTDHSNSLGAYATGINSNGNFDVIYSKVGYYSQTINVALSQGNIAIQDVQLVPIPPFNLTINVIESGTGNPISNAQILLAVPLIEHTGITNGIGQEVLTLFYQEPYMITVGKWGYFTKCFEQLIDQNTGTLTIELEKGYHDEFSFDFGWIVSGTATTGNWERGVPFGTNGGSAPSTDADFDCSNKAYVTGNDPILSADADDVDGGLTLLVSPTMNLTTYTDPHVNFSRWFFCLHGNPPDDTLKVIVSNGLTSVVIDQTGSEQTEFYQWIPKSIRLMDYIALTASMQVSFRVSDIDPNVNITEAGIDYFYVSNANVLTIQEEENSEVNVYPNPFEDVITIENALTESDYSLMNLQGQVVAKGQIIQKSQEIHVDNLPNGIYLLQIGDVVLKVMKD
jgi:choice-of-anchor B domain-containing protein